MLCQAEEFGSLIKGWKGAMQHFAQLEETKAAICRAHLCRGKSCFKLIKESSPPLLVVDPYNRRSIYCN